MNTNNQTAGSGRKKVFTNLTKSNFVRFKKAAKKLFAALFVVVNILSITLTPTAPALAASYTFSQTDWAAGANTSATFTHSVPPPTGSQFYSTSSVYMTTGATLTLATTSDSFLQAGWDAGADGANTIATDTSNTTGWTKFTATSTTQATTTSGVLSLAARTGSFAQTNWTSVNSNSTANHTSDQSNTWVTASTTDVGVDYTTTSGSLQIAPTTPSPWVQTTTADFNTQGNATSTAIEANNSVKLALNFDNGNGGDGSVTFSANTNLTTGDTSASIDRNGASADGFTASLTNDAAAAATGLSVSASSGFVAGDEVMIVQTQHSSNAGKYEFRRISTVNSSTSLTLTAGLTNAYYGATGEARVIRVPNYTSVTINSGVTLTISAYSATTDTSGTLVFKATGAVAVTGIIDVMGLGFAGGAGADGTVSGAIAFQGTSYAGTAAQSTSSLNGGGGGGKGGTGSACCDVPGGGAGGGYAATGTNGTAGENVGGTGGSAYGSATLGTLYLGSGGGGGGGRWSGGPGAGGAGGNGGGAVFLTFDSLTVDNTTGQIKASGNNGGPGIDNGAAAFGADGGGGSGGSIYLGGTTSTLNTTRVVAAEGTGGVSSGTNGGAGSAGRIYVEGSSSGTTNPTATTAAIPYYTSGTYTSAVFNTGQNSDFTTVSWNTATSTLTMEMRTGSSASVDGTWTAFTSVTNGADTGTTFDGKQYVQYRATLTSTNNATTPSFDDITINYKYFSTGDKTLVSSAFNTEESATGISSISWAGATTSAASIKFQVRTASSLAGLYTASWCGPTNCSGTDYFVDANNAGAISNTALTDGSNDQWFQYKAVLATTNTSVTPRLDNVTAAYARVLSTTTLTSSRFNTEDAANGVWKVQWDETGLGSGGNIRMQIATSSNGTMGSFFGTSTVGSFFDYTDGSNGCSKASNTVTCTTIAFTGGADQYIQYKVEITPNANNSSPTVDNIQVFYKRILSGAYELLSSPYNTTDAANVMGSAGFATSSQPTGTNVQMQIRTAPDNAGAPGTWSSWCGPTETTCTGTQYFTAPSTSIASNSPLRAGGNDQWWQYKLILTPSSDGLDAPIVTSATVVYVVNAAPQFNANYPSASAGGASATQNLASSEVPISYSVRDPDTTSGSVTPNLVTPSFEYSLNNGGSWTAITGGLTTNATTTKSVQEVSYTTHYATWTASVLGEQYASQAKIRVTVNDSEIANNTAQAASAAFELDTTKPTFSSFTAGTAVTNNIQYTDADADGVADNRSVTLRIVNLTEHSSSTQAVYLLFSNDGTNYGTSVNATTGVVTAVSEATLANWEATTTAATFVKPWTLLQSGSRTKTVYVKVRDAYGNTIASPASANVSFNKRPEFENVSLSDADASNYETKSNNKVVIRQCNIFDTDANCTAGKVKIKYSVRDPDGNESPLASKGNLHITYATSSDGTTFATSTNSDLLSVSYATTTVSLTNADSAGSYNPAYTTGTAYFNPSISSGNLYVRLAVSDNEETFANSGAVPPTPGTPTVFATSNVISYDATKPTNASPAFTFDAGVAGVTNGASVSINHPSDGSPATTTQYLMAETAATTTSWTLLNGAGPTARTWTFDSDIEKKSLSIKFRDTYGNEQTATTTITNAAFPLSADAFLVQDVSKATQSDWRLYIAWQTSTSTDFASYKLEYATSTDNTTFGSYSDVTTITAIATNYYVHTGLNNSWYYRYRVGVKDNFGNTTVRSNSYINARPDGVQNLGEGGGGTSPSAAAVTNVVPTQGSDGNVTVTYTLTDTSLSSKTTPTYEAYVAYDLGVTLTSSSTSTLILSDTTKLPSSGFIQINQEVIKYTGNATSTGTLSGITRGTWPTASTTRATRQNTNMLSQTQVWVVATSTQTSITNTSIATGQANNSITWNTANDTNLASQYLTGTGIRVLVHDNQAASSAPLSSQSDSSVDSTLAVFDKKAPTLTSTSLLINGSSSSIEVSGSTAPLTLAGVSGDTASETIYIQFATSTPAVYRGANSNGTLNMTENSWGTATSTASLLGSWSWPLSGRSETVTVRLKDAYGNISSTDTNAITKNAVSEFQDTTVANADALGYESLSNNKIAIRQCNVYDTDALCTQGRVKIKFNVRDPDAGESQLSTAGSVTMSFGVSTNGVFATSSAAFNLAYWASDSSFNTTTGTSTVSTAGATSANAGGLSESANYDPAFTTVTVYYTPTTSGTIRVQASVTDSESGSAPVYALSNSISYDNSAPTTGVLTFDGGVVDGTGADRGTITVPVPADATTTQYMLSATTTDALLTTWGWTTYTAASSTAWGFDAPVEAKSVYYRYRDTYGNTTATATAASLVPPTGSSITLEDISTSSSPRLFLSWPASAAADFANYRIEYATSSTAIDSGYSAYAELALITNKDTNYFIHTGLTSSWWYRYRLSTKNTAGNYSVKSVKGSNAYVVGKPDQTLTGDEAYASDTVAPTVTNVATPVQQVTTATISFDIADSASLNMSSAVYYAAAADYNASASSRAKYAYKFGNSGYATASSLGTATTTTIALSGLTKNTAYRFAVEACDTTGNCTLKEPTSGNPYYEFTTLNGPAIVIAPSVVKTYNSATVTWKTDKASDSIVYYSTNSGLTSAVTAGSNTQTTADALAPNYHTHTVGLSGLSRLTTYYYKVRSTDTNGIYSESAILSFTTDDQPTPQITTAASCSTTASTAIVSWVTDQNTTTEVSVLPAGVTNASNYFSTTAGAQLDQYPGGPTTQVTTTRAAADYVASHSRTFTGLVELTTYYVKVQSVNANGGEISAALTCVTPAKDVVTVGRPAEVKDTSPPLIGSVTIKDLKSTAATITWTTDEAADSLVQYGTSINYGALNGNVDLLTEHTVVLSGLNPETAYHFKVTSADRNGNRAYAGDQSLTTLSEKEEALLVKEDLESLRKELEEFRKQAKNPASLQEAATKLKAILKSVSTDIALGDLEELASDISDTITDITQEVVPPTIIGGVPQVDVESTKATVKWRTNKASGSLIALVPQAEYDAKAKDPYTLQVGAPQEEVTDHAVTVPNLEPSTVYHFQIRSQAKVGPEGKSRDFVFETKAELPEIKEYFFRRITENSITVAWKTNTLSTSLVRYTPFDGATLLEKESSTQGKPEFVKDHEVTVSNLKSNTNFLVEISSADVTGATASKVIGTVRTTLDAKGPAITKVRSESTIFPGKAEKTQTIIYWETDEPSTSQVFWKEGVAKGDLVELSRFDQEYTTSHVVVITSFKPGAVYRFQVESVDPSNNKARSTDYTILTPKKGETVIDLIITNFQDIFGFLKKI